VNVADKPDGGADQELEAANDKQPDGRFLVFREEEQDAPHQKPDGDEKVVDDADHFVAAPDDELFPAELQGQGVIGAVFNHSSGGLRSGRSAAEAGFRRDWDYCMSLKAASVLAARIKSFLCRPPISWLHQLTATLPYSRTTTG